MCKGVHQEQDIYITTYLKFYLIAHIDVKTFVGSYMLWTTGCSFV